MRVRKRHAWGAVLIVLFVLPVLKPDGIEAIERPVGSFFAWFARIPVLNPRLWGSDVPGSEGDVSPRAQALEEDNAFLREHYAQRLGLEADLRSLATAFEVRGHGRLDRLPRVLVARVLRSADAYASRRSILIDRGEEDGLVPGLAVASGRVFLGTVEVVRARTALVKLVTDRGSRLEVAVRTEENHRLSGFVHGGGRGRVEGEMDVRFVHVPEEAGAILPGAPVFTSNADELVPPSLIVGYIASVSDKDLDRMPQLRMRPALDLDRSTHVFVLLPPEPGESTHASRR